MTTTSARYIGIGIAAIILGGIGGYLYISNNNAGAPNTLEEGGVGIELEGEGTIRIEEIPELDIRSLMPPLDRAIQFSAGIPAEVRVLIEAKAKTLREKLSKDPADMGAWFNLALQYHQANDYEGARLIWEFLTMVAPKDTTSFDNLGKLYHYSLKNFPKAEEYFRKSIAIRPTNDAAYIELHSLYRYSYKQNTTAGADILKELSAVIPEDPNPHFWLGTYYADLGKYAEAKASFETAIQLATKKGNNALVTEVRDALGKLPQ